MISSLLEKEASLLGPRLRKWLPEARLQGLGLPRKGEKERFPKPKGRVYFNGPEENGQKDTLEEQKKVGLTSTSNVK